MTESRQIFVFKLNEEEYAIDVENVKEIIKSEDKEVISVPNVPDFIEGIANVRGQAVPLINLEKKFDLESKDNDFIVIITLEGMTAGLLVDDVEEVKKVDVERIKEAPEIIEQEIHRKYVDSVVILEDRMIIILDLIAGLKEHETMAVQEINEEMSDDDEEEEVEDVSEEELAEKARERVSKKKEEEESSSEEKEESGSEDEEEEDPEEKSEEEFECEECGDTFDTKRGLASHKAQKH
ncbi:MAG: chemotaxis protein CheW [Candidatus Nanohaloarchaea archaeon]